jgi:hypothetical protein
MRGRPREDCRRYDAESWIKGSLKGTEAENITFSFSPEFLDEVTLCDCADLKAQENVAR